MKHILYVMSCMIGLMYTSLMAQSIKNTPDIPRLIEQTYDVQKWMSPTCAAIKMPLSFYEATKWAVVPDNGYDVSDEIVKESILYLQLDTILQTPIFPSEKWMIMGIYNYWDSLRQKPYYAPYPVCRTPLSGCLLGSIDAYVGIVKMVYRPTSQDWEIAHAIPFWKEISDVRSIQLLEIPYQTHCLGLRQQYVLYPNRIRQEREIWLRLEYPYEEELFSYICSEVIEEDTVLRRKVAPCYSQEQWDLLEQLHVDSYPLALEQTTYLIYKRKPIKDFFVFDGLHYTNHTQLPYYLTTRYDPLQALYTYPQKKEKRKKEKRE